MVTQPTKRKHILTINLEDYFQVGAFQRFVRPEHWQRYESRIIEQTDRTLDLLDQYQAKATFFVLGRVAESLPDLIRKVADRGHEVASRGYNWHDIRHLTPQQFGDDLARSRRAIENASGQTVIGYRTAEGWFRPADLWALEVLKQEGFAYDSSLGPILRNFSAEPWRKLVHEEVTLSGPIGELPISSARILGMDVPIGGNWLRQFPSLLMRRAVRSWESRHDAPLVMYFHTWELDPEQPRFESTGWLTRVRHYRNLDLMRGKVAEYLERFSFDTAAAHLGLTLKPAVHTPAPPTLLEIDLGPSSPTVERTPVSIVIPLYNEEPVIPFLANTLTEVRRAFQQAGYDPRFLLVNDASTDDTQTEITETFGSWPDVTLIAHESNRGVAAAILTGLDAADTEIVCSMDADCTYDPHELLAMIPKLTPDVDLVTASPYHPDGEVRNVPRWRLFLSQGASRLYRRVFFNQLHTYTSCFRVYRRSRVKETPVRYGNFLGVVELLGQLDHRGSRVVEHPTTLSVRLLGRSKMKTLRTIVGHLRLMRKFAWNRLRGRARKYQPADRDRALLLLRETAGTPCHMAMEDRQPAAEPVTAGR
ncbi:glycosyltransferase [Limnoglobus roseus]|uniref:GT2 family glycosyltransferase and putative beta/alpha-barrel-type carbohydrate esterase n=1 Tax=Limnoglobus roseus TaxID=2598579 RepID=A0A5C1A7X9_9BACT|nr:glycosyltransferase [Limnoglobus roseus]QEL15301.1 GT2 family glycosyltransferase and putative beta/alpha-barrel-type carbohydrate esterase [Limnoglobus roseus]